MDRHYESSQVILEENIMDYFFKKRTRENSVYKIFAKVEGNKDLVLEEKFKECTISFMFTDHSTMTGIITQQFEYKIGEGKSLVCYMKNMIEYLVKTRGMTDSGYFCMIIRK